MYRSTVSLDCYVLPARSFRKRARSIRDGVLNVSVQSALSISTLTLSISTLPGENESVWQKMLSLCAHFALAINTLDSAYKHTFTFFLLLLLRKSVLCGRRRSVLQVYRTKMMRWSGWAGSRFWLFASLFVFSFISHSVRIQRQGQRADRISSFLIHPPTIPPPPPKTPAPRAPSYSLPESRRRSSCSASGETPAPIPCCADSVAFLSRPRREMSYTTWQGWAGTG